MGLEHSLCILCKQQARDPERNLACGECGSGQVLSQGGTASHCSCGFQDSSAVLAGTLGACWVSVHASLRPAGVSLPVNPSTVCLSHLRLRPSLSHPLPPFPLCYPVFLPPSPTLTLYVSLSLWRLVQSYVDGLLSSEAAVDTLHSEQLEEGLLRLEDVALILVCGCNYLLAEDSQTLAMARTMRLPLGAQIATMGKQLLTHRRMQDSMVLNAAAVLQRVWRARQRQRQAAAA